MRESTSRSRSGSPSRPFMAVYGARTNRRWTVPVAAALQLPILWYNGLAILIAVLPLWKGDLAALGSARRALEAPSS